MAMQLGGRRGLYADINVTPMIDLLLVLIIIFMVITPVTSVGLKTELPEQASAEVPDRSPAQDIVVSVRRDRTLAINQAPVTLEELGARLQEIFARRATKVIFVSAAADLEFQDVARVIDRAKGAGVFHVALLTARGD